ncbi:MAG: right-handed parallel beta-helix repeat-containing protein [Kiritimatiellia bacterium]
MCPATPAAEWTVGAGGTHARIEEAVGAAAPGDVILVHPQAGNQAYQKVALAVNTPRLTIKAAGGAGERIPLNGAGGDYSGRGPVPRAIVQFNPGADGCVLEGFELLGAHNESHNGAGVRINQADDVTIRSCDIHHNDMGIMSNGDAAQGAAGNQLIENCLVHHNGDPQEPGQNHNLYLGGTSVVLRGCDVHSSLTGHNVKSRAHRTLVTACYIHDSANRELDLVDGKGDTTAPGSDAVLAGNIIVKNPECPGNRAVIHFGQDGGHEHDGTLYLIHNTIVTPFVSPVVQLSAPKARAQLFNNIVWDGGRHRNGQVLVSAGKGP